MIYLRLFLSFFQIGLFSFGGGYASLLLIQNQVVHINGWLTMTEYSDVVTISQMTPGPVGINSATFVGMKVGGFLGAVTATTGVVMPSVIIVLILAWIYKKYRELDAIQGVLRGIRPAVVGMMFYAGLSIMALAFWGDNSNYLSAPDWVAAVIFAVCFFVLRKWKCGVIPIIIGSGGAGLLAYSILNYFSA